MRGAISKKFRSVLAFGLVLWCAGAGCILITYAHSAAMSSADSTHSEKNWGSIMASAGSHDCCKARHSSSKRNNRGALAHTEPTPQFSAGFEQVALPELPAPTGATSCCPLTSGSFVTASHVQLSNSNLSVMARTISLPPALTNSEFAPLDRSIHVPNLNQTYLRDCVFLI
jgi:hypothetical protein